MTSRRRVFRAEPLEVLTLDQVNQLLDLYRAEVGAPSDEKLAQVLGVSSTTVSRLRIGQLRRATLIIGALAVRYCKYLSPPDQLPDPTPEVPST